MGRYDQVIDELRAQRDKIDAAIEALHGLDGDEPAKPKLWTENTRTATVPDRDGQAAARKSGRTIRDVILECLAGGAKLKSDIIAAVHDELLGVAASSIATELGNLKSAKKIRSMRRGEYQLVHEPAPVKSPAVPHSSSMHDKTSLLKTILQVLRHGQKLDAMQIAIQATRLAGAKLTAEDVMPGIAHGLETGDIIADVVGAEGHIRTVYGKKGAQRAID